MNDNSTMFLVDRLETDLVQLTINRPPANALNSDLIQCILSVLQSFAAEPSPPGVVLTGKGDRFFSAGGDIREVAGVEVATPRMRAFHAVLCELERYPGPIVCAVRGYAVGGALEFLLHTDYVVANRSAQVGFPEINHGLLPAAKGMRQAARQLGRKAAQALLYSGDLIDAAKARQLGAIDEIVETEDVTPRAVAVCRQMRLKDRKLFAAIKRSINLTEQMGDDQLEDMTIDDLGAYLEDQDAANARAKFFQRAKVPD
jgi:enoyl-CoA hydratase/carnithine racemase